MGVGRPWSSQAAGDWLSMDALAKRGRASSAKNKKIKTKKKNKKKKMGADGHDKHCFAEKKRKKIRR